MKIISLEKIDSTSSEMQRLLNSDQYDKNSSLFIIADTQTSGRGTQNKTWESPLGNLYLSFNIFHKSHEHLPYFISYALFQTIKSYLNHKKKIIIKWPNDILVDSKKIAGILIECFNDQYIVGIGVNINKAPLPISTSIRDVINSKENIDKNKFLSLFIENLERNKELISTQGFLKYKRMWRKDAIL